LTGIFDGLIVRPTLLFGRNGWMGTEDDTCAACTGIAAGERGRERGGDGGDII